MTNPVTIEGRGRLRHRFWGEYSAVLAIAFPSAGDAKAALPILNAACAPHEWETGKDPAVLVAVADSDGTAAIEAILEGFGAAPGAVSSLAHSVDYGDPFRVSIPVPDVQSMMLPGFDLP